jgi:plastocyanin
MKKTLLFCAATLFIFTAKAQTTHIVTAFDFGFAPENLTVAPGDTVTAIFNGYHSLTEVSEADWNTNTANSNGGFWIGFGAPTFEDWFVLSNPGMKYYICVPHASMGMKGTINVVDPTVGVSTTEAYDATTIATLGNGLYSLKFTNCESFVVITTSGKTVETIALNTNDNQLDIDLSSLSTGLYLGVFLENGKAMKVVKLVR